MPYNLGLTRALENFVRIQQGKKDRASEENLRILEHEVARKKFEADEAHRTRQLDIMEARNQPKPPSYQQYETDTGYGAFDPATGEYAQKGKVQPKPQDFKQFKQEKIMAIWDNLSPDEQKKILGISAKTTTPSEQRSAFGFAEKQAIEKAGIDEQGNYAYYNLSPEQQTKHISSISNQVNAGVPLDQLRGAQITQHPEQITEKHWYGNETTPAYADTTFPGLNYPAGQPPQQQPQQDVEFQTYEEVQDYVNQHPEMQHILNDPRVKALPRRGQ